MRKDKAATFRGTRLERRQFVLGSGAAILAGAAGKAVKRNRKLVGVNLANARKRAAASRDYLVSQLKWPSSVIDTSISGH